MENIIDSFRLDGKLAVVTGGSGHYGSQLVRALASAGAKVCTASRGREKNETFAASLRDEGLDVYADALDLSDEKSIAEFAARTEDAGGCDILVNNAVFRVMRGFYDSAASFNESMKVNSTGNFLITREIGKYMAKRKHGSIINIGSYMGILGADDTLYRDLEWMSAFGSPDYFFHKGGLANLTRLVAGYYGPDGVRCNYLALGGLFNNQDPKFVERYNERTFLKRMANESDVMGSVVFLASDASAYITGAVIPVDGGYSAK